MDEDAEKVFLVAKNIVGGATYDYATSLLSDFFQDSILRFNGVFGRRSGEVELLRDLFAVIAANLFNILFVEAAFNSSESGKLLIVIRDVKLFRDELANFLALRAVFAGDCNDNARMGRLEGKRSGGGLDILAKVTEIDDNESGGENDADDVGDWSSPKDAVNIVHQAREDKDERAEDNNITEKGDDSGFEGFANCLEENRDNLNSTGEGNECEENAESESSELHIELGIFGVRTEDSNDRFWANFKDDGRDDANDNRGG